MADDPKPTDAFRVFVERWGARGLGRLRLALVFGIVVLLAILALIGGLDAATLLGAVEDSGNTGDLIAAHVVVALVAFSIGFLVFHLLRARPQKHPAIVALTTRPEDVVWVYERRVQGGVSAAAASQWLAAFVLGLADGKLVTVPLAASDAHHAWDHLRAALPRATFGYSAVAAARFKESPATLRAAPVE